MVLGAPGVTLSEIEVNDVIVTIKVIVPDVESAEQLYGALRAIGGSDLLWNPWSPTSVRDQIQVTYTARWPQTRANP